MNAEYPHTPAEIGLIRWYRSLDNRMREAIQFWILTGNAELLIFEVTLRHRQIAA